jgi:hypothetical protein
MLSRRQVQPFGVLGGELAISICLLQKLSLEFGNLLIAS